ncbi:MULTISPECIES: phage baseplate assembly protein V [Catenuloplanes]|uniref:Uncharacterized protein involved in type VI secretion and phage assembly n=1 Tax=Catenuloplanes niger TaxID=587534 RepID=A0AAE3ZWF1_9ACTN|nr:phage baseplate assembly protein V [Catenuloplanes niger]MDR7327319.1 uncharacterized protein involved in type VI secretion and phage assembly [Catenuloplanes niger]
MNGIEPRSFSTDRRYYGVVAALVDEVDGDDETRVRLRYPWFDPAFVSDWCRVSQFYAGNGYGAVFVPETGDEVVVAFYQGDMRFPVVLGGVYNGVDRPPTARTGGRDEKIIRTRHGHRLVFDDTRSRAAVRITSAAGHEIELDDAGNEIRVRAANGGRITLQAGAIHLDSNSITVGERTDLLSALLRHVHPVPPSGGTSGLPTGATA